MPDYEGSIVIDRLKNAEVGTGFNAATGEWVNMIEAESSTHVKVSRSALQNAASVAKSYLDDRSRRSQQTRTRAPAPAMDPSMMGWLLIEIKTGRNPKFLPVSLESLKGVPQLLFFI